MPAIPPIAVRTTEEREKKPAPHKLGINPPIVEPTTMPIQMIDLELTE